VSTEPPTSPARVTRFYTAARRIPILVGKLPSGGFIPGGPYTVPQIVVLVSVAAGGYYTMPMWSGQPSTLGNLSKLASAVVVTAFCIRKVRWGGRSIIPAARGALTSYTRGSQPRQAGRGLTARAPRRMRSNILLVEVHPPMHHLDATSSPHVPAPVPSLERSTAAHPGSHFTSTRAPSATSPSAAATGRPGRLARLAGRRAHQSSSATPDIRTSIAAAPRPGSVRPPRPVRNPAARSLAGTPGARRQAPHREGTFTQHSGAAPAVSRPAPATAGHAGASHDRHLTSQSSASQNSNPAETTRLPAPAKELASAFGDRP
jgi:hypothetical protein